MNLVVILLIHIGCITSEDSVSSSDSCSTAPTLSWADAGEPLFLEHCDTCHAATSPDRHDAPESITFDTYDDVATNRTAILAVLDHDPPSMPPVMPMPEDDRELLVSWLRCDLR